MPASGGTFMQLPRSAECSESQCTVRSPQRKHSPGVRMVQTISERKPAARPAVLPDAELRKLDALWRASNYLSVGQIYLLDNPLLRQRLTREHIKPRLLGHWGTTPGLNFIYAHLNRVIRARDANMMYLIGPGHITPPLVTHAYLDGTHSKVYPNINQDEEGMRRLFKQFSFPG